MIVIQILQVIRPAAGGMLTHLGLLLAGLNRAGHEITVACPIDEKMMQCIRDAGISRVLPLDTGDELRPWLDPLVVWRFSRFLHRHPFAIVHAHGAKAALITRLALNYGSKLDYPVVVSYHNEILPASRHPQKRRLRRLMEKRLINDTSHFIAVSPGIKDELIQDIGCPEERVSFIPNGISLEDLDQVSRGVEVREKTRSTWGWPQHTDVFVVGTACRLTREKGIDILLQAAFQAVQVEPSLRFVIIGDGPLAEGFKEDARARGLCDYLHFLGFCDNAWNLFPAFDAFVLASRTEGWPLSIMEAMALGLPVIATTVGGIPEMVDSGKTGILVEPEDVNELSKALVRLATDRPLADKLGEAAAIRAREHFDANTMIAKVEAVYQQLLHGGPIRSRGEEGVTDNCPNTAREAGGDGGNG